MGLDYVALKTLSQVRGFKTVLCLGYPDLVAPVEEVEKLFDIRLEKRTNYGAWHGAKFDLAETDEFFAALGATARYIDIAPSRGVEEICDLNYPVALGLHDLVIDGGTLEHCFHFGQALFNAAGAVAEGGRIFHINPVSMVNHGFYNVSPTLYWDFYTQNGWTIESFFGATKEGHIYDLPHAKRFVAPSEMNIYVVAKRTTSSALQVPKQEKYLKNPSLTVPEKAA